MKTKSVRKRRLPNLLILWNQNSKERKGWEEIFEAIRSEVCIGSYSNIGTYLAKRNLKIEDPKEIRVKRKDLIKLLYKLVE